MGDGTVAAGGGAAGGLGCSSGDLAGGDSAPAGVGEGGTFWILATGFTPGFPGTTACLGLDGVRVRFGGSFPFAAAGGL